MTPVPTGERAGRARIGTSGWVYPHWKGRFYPRGLPQTKWLAYYAECFDTVELNSPFYRQPERSTFERWRHAVPADFTYAVKLNRFITHIKRLNIERDSVERSYGTLAGLGPQAGVVLVQLPPKRRLAVRETRHDRGADHRRSKSRYPGRTPASSFKMRLANIQEPWACAASATAAIDYAPYNALRLRELIAS